MGKIVFFDIDGTLVNTSGIIPESTKLAIDRLRENGVQVAFATGRTPQFMGKVIEELKIDSFVSCNGAYCVHDGKVIFVEYFETEHLDKVVRFAEECGHNLVFLNESSIKVPWYSDNLKDDLDQILIEVPEIAKDFHKTNSIYQVLLLSKENTDDSYRNKVPELNFVRFHTIASDVLPKGMSKAKGIKSMIQVLGYDLSDVYAFGDGLNDLEMFEIVGTAVAMGNANEELKERASFVTKHVDEDGIEFGLKELGLI